MRNFLTNFVKIKEKALPSDTKSCKIIHCFHSDTAKDVSEKKLTELILVKTTPHVIQSTAELLKMLVSNKSFTFVYKRFSSRNKQLVF